MNDIKHPIGKDGTLGYDQFGQLYAVTFEGEGDDAYRVGRVVPDLRNSTCCICGGGWELTGKSFVNHRFLFGQEKVAHETCCVGARSMSDRQEVSWAVRSLDLRYDITEIPNQYWPESYSSSKLPWYKFTLPEHDATLVIGRRKRVWSIQLELHSDTLPASDLSNAFSSEDVTKLFGPKKLEVHAWTDRKMEEYLRRIFDCITPERSRERARDEAVEMEIGLRTHAATRADPHRGGGVLQRPVRLPAPGGWRDGDEGRFRGRPS